MWILLIHSQEQRSLCSWLWISRIHIKLQLTGKSRLILKFYLIIVYVTKESREISKPCGHEERQQKAGLADCIYL